MYRYPLAYSWERLNSPITISSILYGLLWAAQVPYLLHPWSSGVSSSSPYRSAWSAWISYLEWASGARSEEATPYDPHLRNSAKAGEMAGVAGLSLVEGARLG
jgi:hypothetical protein